MIRKLTVLGISVIMALFVISFTGCPVEGPQGPIGPGGETGTEGPEGPQGETPTW